MSKALYSASDVKRILGMDRNMLFYFVKTLRLVEPAHQTKKVMLYDFRELLDLALLGTMWRMGIRPTRDPSPSKATILSTSRFRAAVSSYWNGIKRDRKHLEEPGGMLWVHRVRGAVLLDSRVLTAKQTEKDFERFLLHAFSPMPGDKVLYGYSAINLLAILYDIEEKTGETL